MRRKKDNQRGFSLLIVVILLVLAGIAALVVLEVVNMESKVLGLSRHGIEAKETAEGAVYEILADNELPNLLPAPDDPDMKTTYTPQVSSPFVGGPSDGNYAAELSLLRITSVRESSYFQTRAVVYEVRASASVHNNTAAAEVAAETYRLVGVPQGTTLPTGRHAR